MKNKPKVGERWRWSFCEGPSWCCGGEGVISEIGVHKGETWYSVGVYGVDDDYDEFHFGYDGVREPSCESRMASLLGVLRIGSLPCRCVAL